MKKLTNLSDLLLEQMRDLYDCEVRIHKTMEKTLQYASHPRLSHLLHQYIDQIEEQQMRIRQVFEMLFAQKRGEKSISIISLINQFESLVMRCEDFEILDALIVVNIQHFLHYKIASYGAICTYLKHLSLLEPAEILHNNLEVEKLYDLRFSEIADEFIDREAIGPMV
jgi:ferritin-like metal-binding protein YciE